MQFIDKAIILKDIDGNDVCIFVDKVAFVKEYNPDLKENDDSSSDVITRIGMISGDSHIFPNESICSFLRKVNLTCENCDDVQ